MHWRIERMFQLTRRCKRRAHLALWNRRVKNFPKAPDGSMMFHIGCGEIASPEFVNIDARAYPHVHIVTRDLFDLKAVPDAVASLVYMCHVLEHVPRGMVNKVLREMRRVLKPGGTLRISVPDFDLILAMYEATQRDPDHITGPLMGGQDYEFNFHYSVFAANNLGAALVRTGFVDVRRWDPTKRNHHEFEDWASKPVTIAGKSFPVSLNLEATTPNDSTSPVVSGT